MKMYKEQRGFVLEKGRLDIYFPQTEESLRWKNWKTTLDLKTCADCVNMHGKIWEIEGMPQQQPPLHWKCRCTIESMKAVRAGNGTKDKENGADWWLVYSGKLPPYYLSETEYRSFGWTNGKAPGRYADRKMMTRGVYYNKNHHLPEVPGRVWYEADVNQYDGNRNGHRVLWSNDGLVFMTYDHYATFVEVKGENEL